MVAESRYAPMSSAIGRSSISYYLKLLRVGATFETGWRDLTDLVHSFCGPSQEFHSGPMTVWSECQHVCARDETLEIMCNGHSLVSYHSLCQAPEKASLK
jgi:hypothetical protein